MSVTLAAVSFLLSVVLLGVVLAGALLWQSYRIEAKRLDLQIARLKQPRPVHICAKAPGAGGQGVRCHGDACMAGQLECPTKKACGVQS